MAQRIIVLSKNSDSKELAIGERAALPQKANYVTGNFRYHKADLIQYLHKPEALEDKEKAICSIMSMYIDTLTKYQYQAGSSSKIRKIVIAYNRAKKVKSMKEKVEIFRDLKGY